jgi:hypothetical protein
MDGSEVTLVPPEPGTLALPEQEGQAARDRAKESLSPATPGRSSRGETPRSRGQLRRKALQNPRHIRWLQP